MWYVIVIVIVYFYSYDLGTLIYIPTKQSVSFGSGFQVPPSRQTALMITCGLYPELQVNIISSPGKLVSTCTVEISLIK